MRGEKLAKRCEVNAREKLLEIECHLAELAEKVETANTNNLSE